MENYIIIIGQKILLKMEIPKIKENKTFTAIQLIQHIKQYVFFPFRTNV